MFRYWLLYLFLVYAKSFFPNSSISRNNELFIYFIIMECLVR